MFNLLKNIFGGQNTQEPTLAELRKQDRSKPPRYDVYPFNLEVKNGIPIPYTAYPQEIVPYLQKDMVHFEAGMIALAWKGCEESFEIMFKELRNKDYYRRRVTLVNMEYHDLFEANAQRILKEALLDGHDIVVTLAVKLAARYRVKGLYEELQIVMECWPDDLFIQKTCKQLLASESVYYADIIQRNQANSAKRQTEELVYKGSSQCILQERLSNPTFAEKYMRLVRCYYPNTYNQELKELADKFADEGCGYASLATTMMLHFAEHPDKFKKHYGCEPIQDGEYMTDAIMLDFYCMTDESNRGMSLQQMADRFQTYCSRYGIPMSMSTLGHVNADKFKDCTKTGYVLLFGSDVTMYYKKYQPSHVKGWHVMNVCDVDKDGVATVVSWGRKYTLKVAELREDCEFVWVKYEE